MNYFLVDNDVNPNYIEKLHKYANIAHLDISLLDLNKCHSYS